MKRIILSLMITSLASSFAIAASPFSVNADADGYTGWTESLTSGTGSENGTFIGASGTGMDVNSNSWGLYANTGQTSSRTYDFGSALSIGDSVSISVSLGSIATGGTVGFGLQNSSSTNRFETYYIGGDATDAWKLNDSGGQENITGPSTSFGNSSYSSGNFLTFKFTQLASDAFSLEVNGASVTNASLSLAASDIEQIRIFNFDAGSGNDQFFNSLAVVPEPSTYALLAGIFAFAWIALRRRQS